MSGLLCPVCGSNDGDMPCLYPGESLSGCLRDKRLNKVKILFNEFVDGEEWLVKTTHKKVFYDTLTENFVVSINGGWCSVWGKSRFKNAIKIAETFGDVA